MVGAKGFEPSTSWSRTRRASQAALRPDNTTQRAMLAAERELHISTACGALLGSFATGLAAGFTTNVIGLR